MITGSRTIEIAADATAVYEHLADAAGFPDWQSTVRAVEVRETGPDGRPLATRQTIDAKVRTVSVNLRYRYDAPRSLSWTSEKGSDVKKLEGELHRRADRERLPRALRPRGRPGPHARAARPRTGRRPGPQPRARRHAGRARARLRPLTRGRVAGPARATSTAARPAGTATSARRPSTARTAGTARPAHRPTGRSPGWTCACS
ncbi:hypothetical protein GKE82_08785 [Conexibacter sp. W3-3-2]|nr:hypothetical protein [Conexibacter sp. W3-3-2]